MTLQERIIALANTVAGDVKALNVAQGDLSALPTTVKTNLVGAIAEIHDIATAPSPDVGVQIDDAAGIGATDVTYSVNKIVTLLEAAATAGSDDTDLKVQAAIDGLVDGAGAALDTLKELSAALNDNPNFATEVATALTKRVRVDAAQVFTTVEKKQACENIGIGDPDTDFVAAYTTARNGL